MVTAASKTGHFLAKILGIKLDPSRTRLTPPTDDEVISRGESIHSISQAAVGANGADGYLEDEPTVRGWFTDKAPTVGFFKHYFLSLLPFIEWMPRYNFIWLSGDLVAGITVGAVVIPQGMAYAKLANLPPEFGLYSSFVGVLIYWFFATSKDITIGPVAVMSTLVGNILVRKAAGDPSDPITILAKNEPWVLASAIAVIAGCFVFAIGMLRLGFIVDFIPLPAIAAFMTGSALNICTGQLAGLMGINLKQYNTRESTYKVFINFWRYIGHSQIDAAVGLSALFLLYLIRYVCTFMARRYPKQERTWFFISTLRTAFVMLLYILVSYLCNRHRRTKPLFRILLTVPRGFKHMAVPTINTSILSSVGSELPSVIIVMLIEHIAISKSFGRINGYVINPSQELIAIGFTNIFGPFFGAYAATGSFSRTAIKSKSGVRTPFAGVITAIVVLLAIFALPAMFYYIPNAALSAVIIHAVGDLITAPNVVYRFWRVSPVEMVIFFAGVLTSVFSTIENGIYVTVSACAALLLFRIAKAKGQFLGRVEVSSVGGVSAPLVYSDGSDDTPPQSQTPVPARPSTEYSALLKPFRRPLYLPVDHVDGSNPKLRVPFSPFPGVFVYRFTEGFLYPNATHYTEALVAHIFKSTRRTTSHASLGTRKGDRPWNDPGNKISDDAAEHLPTLKAIVLDFSSVNHVDVTSVQTLIDTRNQLDRWSTPHLVEWHFAGIKNRWTKRALGAVGFGVPSLEVVSGARPDVAGQEGVGEGGQGRWRPVFSVAEVGLQKIVTKSPHNTEAVKAADEESKGVTAKSNEIGSSRSSSSIEDLKGLQKRSQKLLVSSFHRPYFHPDLEEAVHSAIQNADNLDQ